MEQAKAEKELHEAKQTQRLPEVEQSEQHPNSQKVEQTEDSSAKWEVKTGIAEPESPEARKVAPRQGESNV